MVSETGSDRQHALISVVDTGRRRPWRQWLLSSRPAAVRRDRAFGGKPKGPFAAIVEASAAFVQALRRPSEERRSPSRLPNPPCPQCQDPLVRVTVRTSHVVGYRCDDCDETWSVRKPGMMPEAATATPFLEGNDDDPDLGLIKGLAA